MDYKELDNAAYEWATYKKKYEKKKNIIFWMKPKHYILLFGIAVAYLILSVK